MLLHWTAKANGALDRTLAGALLTGYTEVRNLSEPEQQALPGFTMAAAATSFAQCGRFTELEDAAQYAFRSAKVVVEEMRS
ncbi:hypothetical protein D9M70_590460 [compost metagenome]